MAKNYEVGEKYYLPVKVEEVVNTNYGVKISFEDGAGEDTTRICDMPDVLLTAYEIASKVRYRRNVEQENRLEELEKENKELKDENGKLTANVDDLEAGINNATRIADNAVETAQNKEKLITEQRELINKYGMVIDILLDKITALKKGGE